MKSKKRLIKNTIIIAIGKFSTQAVSFMLLPLYTTILTNREYGIYDFINTLILFLSPLITLLMDEAMFRFLVDADTEKEKKIVITQSLVFITVSILIFSILLYIILTLLNYEFKYYLILFLIASTLNGLAQAISRGIGNISLYSFSAFISSLLTIILNIVFIVYFKIGLKGLLLSYIIANTVSPILVFIKVKILRYVSIKNINFSKMKEMIRYSIPLVPNSVSWIIINLSSRLIITPILGAGANGIYAIANKFPNIIDIMYGYFYIAWKEEASRAIKDDNVDSYYNSIYRGLKRILFSVCICMISILPMIFNIIINNNFLDAYKYIPFLVVSMIFGNISGFYGGIFSAKKDTKIMGLSTAVSAIINILINILFINILGLYSAILATVIANIVVCIYRNFKLRIYIIFESDNKFYIFSVIILMFVIICYYSQKYELYILGLLTSIIYSISVNKNLINTIYTKLTKK